MHSGKDAERVGIERLHFITTRNNIKKAARLKAAEIFLIPEILFDFFVINILPFDTRF